MSGFSTLNRWFGRKNKGDKAAPNGKLSKSNTNLSLSISTTDINETSQLEYNRITPLPAVTSNAPFEQTFRITVLLPKDQLYVTRLGARVPLSKLLELVCENKLLDASKYEFRNPVDPSQVYSCDLTIGAVGLSEMRLCHKSDSYDSYSNEEVLKLNRTSLMRESLSSSDFSSRNSKHTTKTASPYSSTNSLNSMDSTGMNYTRTPVSPPPPSLPATAAPKMIAPPRKKRAAPRPPQPIPEKSTLVIENGKPEPLVEPPKEIDTTLPRKDYYVSTPNLSSPTSVVVDINFNASTKEDDHNGNLITNGHGNDDEFQAQVEQKNARNLYTGSVQNLSTAQEQKLPEPSPRKRLIQIKKKSAPAPPPKGHSAEDSMSVASDTLSTPDTPMPPLPPLSSLPSAIPDDDAVVEFSPTESVSNSPQIGTPEMTKVEANTSTPTQPLQASTPRVESVQNVQTAVEAPKPIPRMTTMTLLNSTDSSDSSTTITTTNTSTTTTKVIQEANVSKVILNRIPTPEPRSLSTEPPDGDSAYVEHISGQLGLDDDDNVSKQADSGIGEPVPSPIPDSLPSEGSVQESKSTFESSSDDDDLVKVYSFKLGQTMSKPLGEHKTMQDLTVISSASATTSGENTPATLTNNTTPSVSETSSWNFSIPISPPPNFADHSNLEKMEISEKVPDTPITPKIKERPILNFGALTTENVNKSNQLQTTRNTIVVEQKSQSDIINMDPTRKPTPLQSPTTPLNEIVDELSAIINDKRMDTIIRRSDDQPEIEAAKPNTLSNFSISAISHHSTKPTEILSNGPAAASAAESSVLEEDAHLYRKRYSPTNDLKERMAVTRADSFHTTTAPKQSSPRSMATNDHTNGTLDTRSSSYLSLTKLEQNGLNLNRRRSSSELSIGESPSLQSLEVIKTILNSRKNSSASGSDGESKSPTEDSINVVEEKQTMIRETKVTRVELRPKNQPEQHPAVEEIEKTQNDAPKLYRYTGPPSINFSTWNERPKVQVAIKNEGDYIFGGKNAGSQNAAVTTAEVELHAHTMPRGYRASMPMAMHNNSHAQNTAPPAVAPKPLSTTNRMGIPDREFRIPITVKPLKDHVIENVMTEKEARPLNRTTSAGPVAKRPLSMVATTTTISATATLPRSGEKRFSAVNSTTSSTTAPSLSVFRTTSITQRDTNQTSTTPAPFGQNTLRKTGLKEKILAKEEEARVQQNGIQETKKTSTAVTVTNGGTTAAHPTAMKNSTRYSTPSNVQSAKSEIQLKKSISVFAQPRLSPNSGATIAIKTPLTAPVAPPPPVPSPAFLKSTSVKSNSPATTPTDGAVDPRNQLLEAIRNFKRQELNRN